MKQWNFLQVSIHLRDLDRASGLLWNLGTQGIEEHHLKTSKVRIRAYFDAASDIRALTQKFKFQCASASLPLHSISSKTEIERDWFKKWRVYFQAEDGIRDLTVTGVQTCALPI